MLPTQYEFRANHSTSHALTDVLISLYDNINDEKYTALLLLDLKKAFDTVNHKTLLTKLEHYGIYGPTLNCFASFLTNRFQYVSLENHQSSLKKINCGVPQGSVLGPLIFNVCINDISTSVSCTPRLFADNTCSIVHDKNINNLHKKITTEITSLNKWMIANQLTLNLSKSNLILIQPKSRGHRTNLQRWSQGHKARGQGQGHKKNPRPRPRTAFPRTEPLEAKDSNPRGQGQEPRTPPQVFSKKKKTSSKIFFRRSPSHWRTQNF